MKHLPNIITALRFLGAVCLLLCNPAGTAFWVIYGLCGVSDMVDGYLARRLHAESKTGAVLDSMADIATFAAIQEGRFIRKRGSTNSDPRQEFETGSIRR